MPAASEQAFLQRNAKPTSRRKLEQLAALYEIDVRSITALFGRFLDFDQREHRPTDGEATLPAVEVAHLVAAEVIPAPRTRTADQIVDDLIAAHAACDRRALADAFVISISTGRHDYRSALASYASFVALTPATRDALRRDGIAGLPADGVAAPADDVALAFRRLWKPYVVNDQATYAAFDLDRFHRRPVPAPTAAQAAAFRQLLDAIRALPPDARLTDLQRCMTGIVKGDKYDRQHVAEILGYCDILPSRAHPPMRARYLQQGRRPLPTHFYAREWRFPACFWTGEAGVDEAAVAYWFPGR